MRTPTLGLDPLTATLVSTFATDLVGAFFKPAAPAGLSPSQVAAIVQAREEEAAASSRNAWLLGLGLAAAGAIAFVVITRK